MPTRHTGPVPTPPPRSPVSPIFLLLVAVTVCGGVLATGESGAMITAGVVLLVLAGWAVSLCLHEFGHAALAYRGGDRSVANKGYLTLDIRRYLNPMLSFGLPLLFLVAGGIPLPGGAVWINHWAIGSRLVRSMVSLAGPLINLILGVVLAVAARAVPMPVGLLIGLSYLALVQVLAFLLNILPIPGLDGFGVLEPYLSEETRALADKIRPWAPLAFFVLLIGVPEVSSVVFRAGAAAFAAVGGDLPAASAGYRAFLFWRR
jgi:Zn-dependent protease